jgi:hypothetical protein
MRHAGGRRAAGFVRGAQRDYRPGKGGLVTQSDSDPTLVVVDEPVLRARRIGFLVALLVLVLTGSCSAQAQPATPSTDAAPVWLVVQAFDAATLSPGPTAGEYTLTQTDVHPWALAFTDRPDRLAAHVSTAEFVKIVTDEQSDPLNATFVAPLPDGAEATVVVVLLDAAHDAATGTVTYEVSVLAAEQGDLTAEVATPFADLDMELAFGPGHLFVDDVQVPVRVPVNVCGNSVNESGGLNPAFGNTCVDD